MHRKIHTHMRAHTRSESSIHVLVCVFRCISCVTSKWGCQWNAKDHSCSDREDAVDGEHIVKSQQVCVCVCVPTHVPSTPKADVCVFTLKSNRCPQFESPEPLLIPVGFEIPISFQGRNLDIYKVRRVKANRFHHHHHHSFTVCV